MFSIVDKVQLCKCAVGILHGHLDTFHQTGNDVSNSFAAVHQLILGHVVAVVLPGALTGSYALGCSCGCVFGRVFQSFDHFPLDGGADRSVGGVA